MRKDDYIFFVIIQKSNRSISNFVIHVCYLSVFLSSNRKKNKDIRIITFGFFLNSTGILWKWIPLDLCTKRLVEL